MFVFWIPLGTFGSLIYVLMAIHTFRVIAISKNSSHQTVYYSKYISHKLLNMNSIKQWIHVKYYWSSHSGTTILSHCRHPNSLTHNNGGLAMWLLSIFLLTKATHNRKWIQAEKQALQIVWHRFFLRFLITRSIRGIIEVTLLIINGSVHKLKNYVIIAQYSC